jgi:hypothetical protein
MTVNGFGFDRWIEGASQIKLKGGIFTVGCRVLITFIVFFTLLSGLLRDLCFAYLVLGGSIAIILILMGALIYFAMKNPQAAILEGAEFLAFEKLKIEGKGDILSTQPRLIDTATANESQQLICQPDVEGKIEEGVNNGK